MKMGKIFQYSILSKIMSQHSICHPSTESNLLFRYVLSSKFYHQPRCNNKWAASTDHVVFIQGIAFSRRDGRPKMLWNTMYFLLTFPPRALNAMWPDSYTYNEKIFLNIELVRHSAFKKWKIDLLLWLHIGWTQNVWIYFMIFLPIKFGEYCQKSCTDCV